MQSCYRYGISLLKRVQKRFHYPGWDVHRRSWDFINVINLFSLWPISLNGSHHNREQSCHWLINLHQVGILVPGMVLGRTLSGLCRQAEWLWASSCTSGSQENAQPLLGSIVMYTLPVHSPMIILTVFSPKTPSESFNSYPPALSILSMFFLGQILCLIITNYI